MESADLSDFLQNMSGNIAELISGELKLESENKSELINLIETLPMIQAFLKDAEEWQLNEASVKLWLDKLRDVAYDANDLLDELATEAQRQKLIRFKQVRNSLSILNLKRGILRHDVAHRITEIKEKMDGIENNRRTFDLRLRDGARHQEEDRETALLRSSSSSFPPLGRENDKRSIIDLLVSSTREAGEMGITVIPVLGFIGIGKTTLAQHVCSDVLVKKHFDLSLWVYVSSDFNIRKVTKCIIEGIEEVAFDPISLDVLLKKLQTMLSRRKYLLVLDDVWSSSLSKWEMLRTPLLYGAKGSKILVTTRSEEVALVMGTVNPYRLQGLSDDDCLSIFCHHALYPNSSMRPDFSIISNEIVNKCNGNPLMAKGIGLRLRGETDTSKWGAILQNYMTEFGGGDNEILRSIRLSYKQLPAGLKPCVAYCSIFPKGFLFDKELLVQLWMAQNFLQPRGAELKRMEDVGENYFDTLVRWEFFQYSHFDYMINQPKYTMHSVIHDFALYESGEECCILEIGKPCHTSDKTRHCSLLYDTSVPMGSRSPSSNRAANIFEKVNPCKGLYTLLAIGSGSVFDMGFTKDIASKFIRLRSLDLSDSGLSEMPESITELQHLRYLQLRNTNITSLPESLGCLYNLQTLGLRNCYALKELPKDTKYLRKLRHLDLRLDGDLVTISEEDSSRHPRWGSLRSMPPKMGQLTDLQTLSRFVVGTKKRCGLSELQDLNSLHGKLRISNLHLVQNPVEATDADLISKEHLHQLELRWSDGGDNTSKWHADIVAEQVLGRLRPHAKLKELKVAAYNGASFPSWIGDSSFSNLVTLVLSDCMNCKTLPTLGQLPSLKDLYIMGMDAVTLVDCAFCGTGTRRFPALEKLHFERMRNLQVWCGDETCELHSLRELVFKYCIGLQQITHKLPSLTKLVIEGSRCLTSLSSLTVTPPRIQPSDLQRNRSPLRRLEISHCDQLASLPDDWLPVSLTYLAIRHCPQLHALPRGLKDLEALKDMEIEDCAQIQTLPDWLPKTIQFLSIENCPALKQRCLAQDWPKIARLSSVWIDKQQVVPAESSHSASH